MHMQMVKRKELIVASIRLSKPRSQSPATSVGPSMNGCCHRTTPHTVTGKAPAVIMFERTVNNKLPSLHPSAQRDAQNYKQKSKRYHDTKKNACSHSLKVGDSVLIRSENKGDRNYVTMASRHLSRPFMNKVLN